MSENNEFTFENPQYRKTYWHTCSHVTSFIVVILAESGRRRAVQPSV